MASADSPADDVVQRLDTLCESQRVPVTVAYFAAGVTWMNANEKRRETGV